MIGSGGSDIKEGDVMNHVAGYVLALDMTDRACQVQQENTLFECIFRFQNILNSRILQRSKVCHGI